MKEKELKIVFQGEEGSKSLVPYHAVLNYFMSHKKIKP